MTQTFTQDVLIDGSQDAKQLRVQANPQQTEPLQTWEDSSGSVLAQVADDGSFQIGSDSNVLAQLTSDGRLQIGDNLGLATPDALLEAHRAETSTAKPTRGIHSLGRVTTLVTDLVAWMVAELELLGAAGVSSLQTAFRAKVTHNNTGDSSTADIRAGDFEAINDVSNGAVGQLTAVQATITNHNGAAINKAIGLRVAINDEGSIAKPYAIYVEQGTAHFNDDLELRVLPATPEDDPESGFIKTYSKLQDGTPQLFAKDSSGVETQLGGTGGSPASTPPGIISMYGGSSAPEGWLICDGRALSRATYSGLYEVIGNSYAMLTMLTARTNDAQGDLTFPDANHNLTPGSATLKLRFYRVVNVASVSTSTNQLTFASAHTLSVNDRVRVSSTGTLPAPLVADTDYYVRLISSTVIELSTTSGGAAIDLTSVGSGTITITGQDEITRTGMTIETVAGAVVTVSGGLGGVLPQDNVTILVECDSGQFFLPDMSGRVPIGTGTGSGLTTRSLGQLFGEETHLLTIAEMPSHNHTFSLRSQGYGSGGGLSVYTSGATFSTASTGGGLAHNIVQPSLALNYIIKT